MVAAVGRFFLDDYDWPRAIHLLSLRSSGFSDWSTLCGFGATAASAGLF
jgi:hypothetical protein